MVLCFHWGKEGGGTSEPAVMALRGNIDKGGKKRWGSMRAHGKTNLDYLFGVFVIVTYKQRAKGDDSGASYKCVCSWGL